MLYSPPRYRWVCGCFFLLQITRCACEVASFYALSLVWGMLHLDGETVCPTQNYGHRQKSLTRHLLHFTDRCRSHLHVITACRPWAETGERHDTADMVCTTLFRLSALIMQAPVRVSNTPDTATLFCHAAWLWQVWSRRHRLERLLGTCNGGQERAAGVLHDHLWGRLHRVQSGVALTTADTAALPTG